MKLLSGRLIAEKMLSALKADILASEEKPGLAVVLVGENQASRIYVRLKEKRAKEIGMNFFLHKFPAQTSQAEILQCLAELNVNEKVHGIIVQLPLPAGFETEKIIFAIDPKKDVDGFHPANSAKFLQGKASLWPVFPSAIVRLLESSGENLVGKTALVLGNSKEFGVVMVSALQQKGLSAQFLTASEIPSQLGKIKAAEVLVSALGSPELLSGQMLKDGALVIDGGIEKVGDRVLGDVDFGSTKGVTGYLTPVPGGVGPVTIACLLENTWLAFKARK
ncbi:MAG: bifunctional 5,10-methylenetetrahydrofolate dehydrogenase/5,10-methenyltetrahydrofolate cyclohydrolase [Candidatus Moraniibacteriota bacterium]